MAKELVTDELLWEVIEPLLPKEAPKPNGGRPRVDDRATLTGILFVLNLHDAQGLLDVPSLYPDHEARCSVAYLDWDLHHLDHPLLFLLRPPPRLHLRPLVS